MSGMVKGAEDVLEDQQVPNQPEVSVVGRMENSRWRLWSKFSYAVVFQELEVEKTHLRRVVTNSHDVRAQIEVSRQPA